MALKIERITGARRRTNEGWTQTDMIAVNGRRIKGQIVSHGRRKNAESVVTQYGTEQRPGSDPYWLAVKNGIVVEESEVA